MSTAVAEGGESPFEHCPAGASDEAFYRDVAFHLGQAHDNYLEAVERADENGINHNGKSYFLDVHKYIRPSDADDDEEMRKIRDAYFQEYSTTRGEIWKESKMDVVHTILGSGGVVAGGGLLAGAAATGHADPMSLQFVAEHIEAFVPLVAGAVYGGDGLWNIHREHGPAKIKEGLKYVQENKSLPPSETDVKRWQGIEENLDIVEADEIDRYLGDLPELYGEDLDGIDLDDLGTLHSDETPEDCEIGIILYYNELPDYSIGSQDPPLRKPKPGMMERVRSWLT